MSAELIVILAGAGVVVLSWLLLRFGRIIARWTLAFGALAAVIVVGLALLENARTTRTAVKVAAVAGAGAAGTSALAVVLALLLVASLAVVCWLAWRLKLVEGGEVRLLPKRKRRRLHPQSEPVVYYILEADDVEETVGLDLWEVDKWTHDDWQF